MTILDQETLTWIAVADQLPDADTTVLVFAPGADEPVWLGFYNGKRWACVEGFPYGEEGGLTGEVTAWAAMPKGATC